MRMFFKAALPVMLLSALLLAGCSFTPRNIPTTGGTATPAVTGTPLAGNAGPTNTAAPAATNTAAPANTQAPAPTDTEAAAAPTSTTAPSGNPTAAPAVIATATTAPVVNSIALPAQRQTIQFPPNSTSSVVATNLQSGSAQSYQLQANAGQRMWITIDGNAVMQIYGPNQNPLTNVISAINPVQIPLSQAGMYFIALQGSGPVVMSIYIPASGSSQNIPAPVPSQLQAIQFQAGATSANFTVNMTAGTPLGYTLNVQAGQKLTVTTSGNATVTLLAPDRATMVPSAPMPTHQWLFSLGQSGTYTLILLGSGPVTVTTGIPAVPVTGSASPTPNPNPIPPPATSTRVTFGAGNASATRNITLSAGTPQAFVLNVQQGQTLYVSTTGKVDVTIYGPGNAVLANGHANFPNRWSALASQTGDYTFVVSGNGPCTLVFFVPPK